MPHHKYLDEILTLDPAKDYERIVFLDSVDEFPFDTTRALEFALFRTYPNGYKLEEPGPADAPSGTKAKVAKTEHQTP